MPIVSLKSLLNKRKETAGLLSRMAAELGVSVYIEDLVGNCLLGNPEESHTQKVPVQVEGKTLGWVYGQAGTSILADLLSHLAKKETEKKQVGSEVLDLYREINLIYNFSEKLANALDAEMIAKTALDEVSQIIEATGGAVIFLPETEDAPQLLATKGKALFQIEDLEEGSGLVSEILLSGKSGVVNDLDQALGKDAPSMHALLYAPLKVKHRLLGVIILASDSLTYYKAAELKLLTTLALQSAAAIESALLFEKRIQEAREREDAIRRIHEVTTRFVPYEFISALGRESLIEVVLGDQVEREVTVFFNDIRDYTALSESMTPEDNFRFVNAFNSRMGPVIYQHQGFINQYLGDGIMAIFPKNPADALQAAVHMQQVLQKYNRERSLINRRPIQIGVGLHTGPLIMGIIGDDQRMEAATIADTVNTAARIESLTKHYGVNILLSEDSFLKVGNRKSETGSGKAEMGNQNPELIQTSDFPLPASHFHFRYLGKVQVKGKKEPMGIFECFDGDLPEMIEKKLATASLFAEAMENYHNQNFPGAQKAFQSIITQNPSDHTTRLLLTRIEAYQQQGLPENWTGVEKMNFK